MRRHARCKKFMRHMTFSISSNFLSLINSASFELAMRMGVLRRKIFALTLCGPLPFERLSKLFGTDFFGIKSLARPRHQRCREDTTANRAAMRFRFASVGPWFNGVATPAVFRRFYLRHDRPPALKSGRFAKNAATSDARKMVDRPYFRARRSPRLIA